MTPETRRPCRPTGSNPAMWPVGDPSPVVEIRWFVPGRLPAVPWIADLEAEERTDLYHLPTLSPTMSVKRRGGAALESKRRTRPPEPVEYLGRPVVAEHWVKRRLRSSAVGGSAIAWLPVHKRVWRGRRFQLAALDVGGDQWWTLAVNRGSRGFRVLPNDLRPLVEAAGAHPSCSYAAWLLDRHDGRSRVTSPPARRDRSRPGGDPVRLPRP